MKRIFLGLLLTGSIVSLVIFNSCTENEEPVPDKVSCSITQPADNETVQEGQTVSITAQASYNNGTIAKVRFYVDGTEVGSSSASPFTYDWNTTGTSGGEHTVKATAETGNGKSASDEIKVLVIGDATMAEAGKDTAVYDGSTSVVLYANAPQFDFETGEWTMIEGEGGSFDDPSKPDAEFSGNLQTIYKLVWTISNIYDSSSDTIEVMFNSVTDIDGNVYRTVKIGDQWWMAENLKVTKFPDGTDIPLVTDNKEWGLLLDNDTDKAYCFYSNSESLGFGALYTYAAATNGTPHDGINNVQGACPTGWHIPSDDEWQELIDFVAGDGHKDAEARALKSTSGWQSNNGTDVYGFSALAGGYRLSNTGEFYNSRYYGWWWSATEVNGYSVYTRLMTWSSLIVERSTSSNKSIGFSVRCVQD